MMAVRGVTSTFQKGIRAIGHEPSKGCAIASWLPRGICLTNASSANLAGRVATRSLCTEEFSGSAKVDMQRYEELAYAPNEIVGARLLGQGVRVILQKFGDTPGAQETTEELWDRIAYHATKFGTDVGSFTPSDPHTNILTLSRIFSRERVTSAGLEKGDNPENYISTPTELYWTLSSPGAPFTRGFKKELMSSEHMASLAKEAKIPMGLSSLSNMGAAEEDALAAMLMALPHLGSEALLHEIGCWTGENLARTLSLADATGKSPAAAVGTDINLMVLNMAEIAFHYLRASASIHLYLGNATAPASLSFLGAGDAKVIRIGLRVIPVLEREDALKMLKALRSSIQNPESVLVLSYPMMEGEIFERNQKRVVDHPDDFKKVLFEGGMTFMTPFEYPQILPLNFKKDMVVNTYYSDEGFEKLANEGGWEVVQSLIVSKYSDTKRCVVKLVAKGNDASI